MFVVSGNDALIITHNNGSPLEFSTRQICRQHVTKNLNLLMQYATYSFEGAVVREIDCYRKPLEA